MKDKELKVLKILYKEKLISQRRISEISFLSLGSVNTIINMLIDEGYVLRNKLSYRNIEYEITKKALEFLDNQFVTKAVILAAGMGMRLESGDNKVIPAGFVKINGKSLIEISMEKLINNGIEEIIIVTGHLNKYYEDLKEKYKEVTTIKNEKFESNGSMLSLALADRYINEDFILIESDLIYEEIAIKEIQYTQLKDCTLLSDITEHDDVVFVEVKNNNLCKISKSRHSLSSIYGEMVGITKISNSLYKKMLREYEKSTNPFYHYEYALEDLAKEHNVGIIKLEDFVWADIDNAEDIKRVKEKVLPILKSRDEI